MIFRAWISIVAMAFFVGCAQGGTFDRGTNSRFSPPAAKLAGHCTVSQAPLVLNDGYCVEFYRDTPPADSPSTECQQVAGQFATGACAQPVDLAGRCYVKLNADMNVFYFAGTANGPAQCAAGGSLWQSGTAF